MDTTLTSRCLCGQVTVQATGTPRSTVNCHCLDCRRATGAAFGTVLYFDKEAVRISGDTASFDTQSDRGTTVSRHFCPFCGSQMIVHAASFPKLVGLRAGGIEQSDKVAPQRNVFMASRITSTPVDKTLPGFPGMP